MALLEEMCHWGVGFEALKALGWPSHSLSAACGSGSELLAPVPVPHLPVALLPAMMIVNVCGVCVYVHLCSHVPIRVRGGYRASGEDWKEEKTKKPARNASRYTGLWPFMKPNLKLNF